MNGKPLRRDLLVLLPAALALLLLVPRLDWGFLSTAPGVPIVHTAEPDEHHLVEGLLRMSLAPFRPDPVDRSWGGLSFTLLGALVAGADFAGAFPGGWRAALLSGDLERARPVLLVMRSLSVLAVLACLLAAYVLARRKSGLGAGLLAATLVAISPAMALSGRTFVTDALETALVVLAFVPASPVAAGLLMGLAMGTKYSAAAFLPALVLSAGRERWRTLAWSVPLGFALAAPFVVVHARSSVQLLFFHLAGVHGGTAAGPHVFAWLWRWHVSNALLYLIGPVGLFFAGLAIFRLVRGDGSGTWRARLVDSEAGVPLLLVLGQLVWLIVSNFPVLRYELPLVPFLAVWAAQGLVRVSRARGLVFAGVLAPPAVLAFVLVFGVARTHPFESAGVLLRREVRGGERVGRIWSGMPQLPGIQTEELKAFPNPGIPPESPAPDFLVDDDLPPIPFAPEYVAGRERDYKALATLGGEPRLFGMTWPRVLTPHDARYPSPLVTVWEKTSRSAPRPAPAPRAAGGSGAAPWPRVGRRRP